MSLASLLNVSGQPALHYYERARASVTRFGAQESQPALQPSITAPTASATTAGLKPSTNARRLDLQA